MSCGRGPVMRFSDIRQTLLKKIDTPDPENPAKPKWISAQASGYIAAGMKQAEIPLREANRRTRRANGMGTSRRIRIGGVALKEKPWKV